MFSIEGIIANSGERKRIEIDTESGLFTKITEVSGVADVVLENQLIFPGFIDIHVHAREDESHTQDYKEDFISASKAAINGGVVAFADMTNNIIAPIDDTSYETKNSLAKKSLITVLLYGGIGPKTNPLEKVVPYKVFMGPSVGDLFFTNREDLEQVISQYAEQNVSFHCEEPTILEENTKALSHETRRPPEAEISAIDFALYLIEKYNIVGKICHCSTIEGINKIINAKKKGLKVSVEVTPHHLYFDETMLGENRKTFQVNPPIRQTTENRLALISLLKSGDIDYLATDHAPHTTEENIKGTSGLTHLDTYGYFVSYLINEHNFTAKEITKVCSENPGNFINKFLTNKYGKIEKDYTGSLTILDMNKKVTITKNMLKTKCKWSPFEGITFPGNVKMTIIKGKVYEK